MKLWQRRLIGILTLGGSFLGMVITIPFILSQEGWLAISITILFVLTYCIGIWCGMRLLEASNKSLMPITLFWTLQIPYLMSPLAGYSFASGALFYVYYRFPEGFGWLTRLGSQFEYSILQPEKPFTIGINLFAVLVASFLAYQWNNSASTAIEEAREEMPVKD